MRRTPTPDPTGKVRRCVGGKMRATSATEMRSTAAADMRAASASRMPTAATWMSTAAGMPTAFGGHCRGYHAQRETNRSDAGC